MTYMAAYWACYSNCIHVGAGVEISACDPPGTVVAVVIITQLYLFHLVTSLARRDDLRSKSLFLSARICRLAAPTVRGWLGWACSWATVMWCSRALGLSEISSMVD